MIQGIRPTTTEGNGRRTLPTLSNKWITWADPSRFDFQAKFPHMITLLRSFLAPTKATLSWFFLLRRSEGVWAAIWTRLVGWGALTPRASANTTRSDNASFLLRAFERGRNKKIRRSTEGHTTNKEKYSKYQTMPSSPQSVSRPNKVSPQEKRKVISPSWPSFH